MRIYVYNYVYSSERRGGGGKTLLDRDTSTFRYHTSCWTETLLTSVITLPAGQRHFYRQVLHFLLDRDTSTFRYYAICWTETLPPSGTYFHKLEFNIFWLLLCFRAHPSMICRRFPLGLMFYVGLDHVPIYASEQQSNIFGK